MKNIVCPISTERISEHIPRITALFVIILLLLYVITQSWIIPAFLVIDFYTRGFGKAKFSALGILSSKVGDILPNKGKAIPKAPKVFAARLGFIFTSTIVALHIAQFASASALISFALILFAGLECIANFCVGCWVYTLFVQPFYRN
ncbi:DUF4395 domain-containing protein [Labilibacter sediminis]|nr:DUF4395 domain-containing protein [Labilibacter sediminis]